jgi:hypothetical protein
MAEYIEPDPCPPEGLSTDFLAALALGARAAERRPGRVCCDRKYTFAGYEAHCRRVHKVVAVGEIDDARFLEVCARIGDTPNGGA